MTVSGKIPEGHKSASFYKRKKKRTYFDRWIIKAWGKKEIFQMKEMTDKED